jgi:hypothetical protein
MLEAVHTRRWEGSVYQDMWRGAPGTADRSPHNVRDAEAHIRGPASDEQE